MALAPTTVSVNDETWTQLTNADATSISFQNLGPSKLLIKGAASASAPTDEDGALEYPRYMGEANVALADLFPGMSAVRVYAKSFGPTYSRVSVSHA